MSRTYLWLVAAAGIAASLAIIQQGRPMATPQRLGAAPVASTTTAADPCGARCGLELEFVDGGMEFKSFNRCVRTCRAERPAK